ncbi:MAG: O-methyltransferase [Spirochaetales bacterium]
MARALSYTRELLGYVDDCNYPETEGMRQCREYTERLPEHDMQIPPDEGSALVFLTRLFAAGKIVEIGTFTGYSSLCFAQGMGGKGSVTCVDRSSEWLEIARGFWNIDGVTECMEIILGEAVETVPQLAKNRMGQYDIAFIDADKQSYQHYFEHCLSLVRAGGLIIVDNVLWHGNVADPAANDPDTEAIREFNRRIRTDSRVFMTLLPFSDGITLAVKRETRGHHE